MTLDRYANELHIVSRSTAARALLRIDRHYTSFDIHVRQNDLNRMEREVPSFSHGLFTRQVTEYIAEILRTNPRWTKQREVIKLRSITASGTSPDGLLLHFEMHT
jgi:hypothetical protein